MAEELIIPTTENRAELYESLIPQVKALIHGEPDMVANMANTVAAIKQTFDFFWIGFYVTREDQLVLGPFQGPIACTRIRFDKGVCGASYTEKKTIIVPDVDQFPGHIACSSDSKSEIVVPVIKAGEVKMVLDVDSDKVNDFSEVDQAGLEQIAQLIAETL
ncbi:GAF domain-containing protein [marine bacterium AO1-C]|nr:GAF domain-containing protein [marine bacterium AO1-C]